jgi:hypothetical protein
MFPQPAFRNYEWRKRLESTYARQEDMRRSGHIPLFSVNITTRMKNQVYATADLDLEEVAAGGHSIGS